MVEISIRVREAQLPVCYMFREYLGFICCEMRLSGFSLFVLLVLISFECNLFINQWGFWREKWKFNMFFFHLPLETNNADLDGGLTHWQEVIIKKSVFLLPIKSFLNSLYMSNLDFISIVTSENNKIKFHKTSGYTLWFTVWFHCMNQVATKHLPVLNGT